MKRLSLANLCKAKRYLERNGLGAAWYAVRERLEPQEEYCYRPPSERELEEQRHHVWDKPITISVVVPAFCTPRPYMQALLDAMLAQTYPYWELVIADATAGEGVENIVKEYRDGRIQYYHLDDNLGIADNTNRGIRLAGGDYIGLLDHDDVLTADALFRVAECIESARNEGRAPVMVYSDEDKCDREGRHCYEPHRKPDFDLELLLSNNYICHFLVVQAAKMKELGLRRAFDGAQDYDLVLRIIGRVMEEEAGGERPGSRIAHIHRVLYHWRCHEASTAQNPDSKSYAYLAGEKALEDFMKARGWRGAVEQLRHLGFYRINYEPSLWEARPEVGCVGGSLFQKRRLRAGAYEEDGSVRMAGLPWGYSGYMHRGVLRQEAPAVDLRLLKLRPECRGIFEAVTGCGYVAEEDGILDVACLPPDTDYRKLSLRLGAALREAGYVVIWDPQWRKRL